MRPIGAAEAALISLLEPILAPIWVAMVHGERLARFTLVDGRILLAGVAIKYVPWGGRGRHAGRIGFRTSPVSSFG